MPSLWNCLCPRRRDCSARNKRRKYSTTKYTQHVNNQWALPHYIDGKCVGQSVQPLPPETMPYITDTLPWYKRKPNTAKDEPSTVVVRPGVVVQQSIFAGMKVKSTSGHPPGQHPSAGVFVPENFLQDHHGQDHPGKSPRRPHVQEIFMNVSHSQDQTLNMSFTSFAPSSRWAPEYNQQQSQRGRQQDYQEMRQTGNGLNRQGDRRIRSQPDRQEVRQTDGLRQYTPRSLQEDAGTAALFGNRMDDFVHDPKSWNHHIDRFAASPSPSRVFSSGESSQSFQSPHMSPTHSNLTCSSQRYFMADNSSVSHVSHSDGSESSSRHQRSRSRPNSGRSAGPRGSVHSEQGSYCDDVFVDDRRRRSRDTKSDSGSNISAQDYFCAGGDVLY